jgi:Tfp pilus assembly protein PilN
MPVDTVEKTDGHSISFDKRISLGNVLTLLSLLGILAGSYVTYRVTISEHETRIQALELSMQRQSSANSELSTMMYNIRQDVAVIRDRLERSGK